MDREILLRKSSIVSRQILLGFVDVYRAVIPFFDKARFYRVPFKAYDKFRENDRIRFSKEMYRLKKLGFIKTYIKNKEKFVVLTLKGKELAKTYFVDQMEIKIPKEWDQKWHLVIFDIPNDKKGARCS